MRDHLATLLDDFRRYGQEIAVVRYRGVRRKVATYGQIADLAGRFAALLDHRGIAPGDRVLIWAENSAEWIAAFHGCMLRGVLAVPLDAAGSADVAARIAADVNPALAVGDSALVSQLPAGTPRMAFEEWPSTLPSQQAGPMSGLSADTPLEILFTSGTTGDPKGIVLTHGNVLASFAPIEKASQPYLKYERPFHPLRILHTLPLSHVFGQTMGLWVPSIYRAELHFESRLVASRIVETIRRERISVLAAVPRVHALLKSYLESTLPGLSERLAANQVTNDSKARLPKTQAFQKGLAQKLASAASKWWRFRDVHRAFGFKFWVLISGGGALPAQLEAFWNAVGLVVVQGYGMTESTALITLNHPFHIAQGTVGKPLAGREVKLGPDGEVLVRGAAVSHATWSRGALHPRTSEWLATGDLAEAKPTGELRFVGRKSEVIVTAAGVNLHPEDLEAAIERESGVAACAVVPIETADGPEPLAVLSLNGDAPPAAKVIERANAHLAEYQRLRRWVVWLEPDLPRTSTGKVRRKVVAAAVAEMQSVPAFSTHGYNGHGNGSQNGKNNSNSEYNGNGKHHGNGVQLKIGANGSLRSSSDWLLDLIAQITGETPAATGDESLLTEDLRLDSLGRVQLAAALEERTGVDPDSGLWERVQTLGDLRRLAGLFPARDEEADAPRSEQRALSPSLTRESPPQAWQPLALPQPHAEISEPLREPLAPATYRYPHWPWWPAARWLRTAFVEAAMRPLVWLLSAPRVAAMGALDPREPMIIVANHGTAFDGPLLQYALPPAIRRRIAVAMSGEMLEDYRRFRNPNRKTANSGFFLPGPLFYFLLTALFNVFPLPRRRDIQRSFAHAGEALDNGMNVLLFPEGTRSKDGRLASFRPGIGMLVKQSNAPVLPMAIRGLGELKAGRRRWFRSGTVEVRIGMPLKFAAAASEAAITERLHAAVDDLLSS
jgi:long-chain acyl-CoA synthetase